MIDDSLSSTEFNSEADDGGFLEAKLKALESAAMSRGQAGRKSFHYIRMKESQNLAASVGQVNGGQYDKEQLIRVHSLPANRVKKKSNTLGAKRIDVNGKGNNHAKIPVQGSVQVAPTRQNKLICFLLSSGFDMFRHHLGQMNCDVALFEQLESDINTLNAKLQDLEQTRQDCLARLSELDSNVRQGQLLTAAKVSNKRSKANDLALRIIGNYITRIDNLLKVEEEPFLVDVKIKEVTAPKSAQQLSQSQSLSSQFEASLKVEVPSSSNVPAREKRQQIKEAYNHLIKFIMPKLFGKQFAHRDEANYRGFKQNLSQLREQVNFISTSDEQKLMDAKRIFLQEMDCYLRTIDEMVTCSEKECQRCKVTS